MLTLESPVGTRYGATVYRDHANPDLFYYVAERPRLARTPDGRAELVFLKYRRDITDSGDVDNADASKLGGGFLAFTVELSLPESTLEALGEWVGDQVSGGSGSPRLVPVRFREGTVRLSVTQTDPTASTSSATAPSFFEQVYGATKPSLFGSNRATFSLVLSREGATLIEAGLRSGVSPVGVLYDLEFLALRPSFEVRLTAQYKRVFDSVMQELSIRGSRSDGSSQVAFASDIASLYQKAIDDGSVKVEVLNFTDSEDLKKKADDALKWFKDDLMKDFFKPALSPPDWATKRTAADLVAQLQALYGGMQQVQRTGQTEPQLGEPTTEPGLSANAPTALRTGVVSGRSRQQTVAQNAAASAGRGMLFGAYTLKTVRLEELKTRVFEFTQQDATAVNIAPQGLFSTLGDGVDLDAHMREVDLDDDFFRRIIATFQVAGDLEGADVDTVAVNVEYPAALGPGAEPVHVDGFVFRPAQLTPGTFTTWLDAKRSLEYRYQAELHFKARSDWRGATASLRTDWLTSAQRQLVFNPLDHVTLLAVEVRLGLVDLSDVSRAQIDLVYDDGAGFRAEDTVQLGAGTESALWKLRLTRPDRRAVRYTVTWFLPDNSRLTMPEQETESPTIILQSPFQGRLRLTVLTSLLSRDDLAQAFLTVTYREPDGSLQSKVERAWDAETLPPRDRIEIPTLSAEPGPYDAEIVVIHLDGQQFSRRLDASTSRIVRMSAVEGAVRHIKVRLPGESLESAGLVAVRVTLQADDAEAYEDSVLFTPSKPNELPVTLGFAPDNTEVRYRWTVTGYLPSGEPLPSISDVATETDLVLSTPRP